MTKLTEKELEYQRNWRAKRNADPELLQKHRDYQREYQRAWKNRPENREKLRAASLAHYYKNQEREINRSHWYNVLKRYGITQAQYEQIIAVQGGGCAICGEPRQEKNKRLSIDHCHRSTVIRGILCESCNVLLGNVEAKAADWMERAQKYLSNPPAAKIVAAKCTRPFPSNLRKVSNW